MGGKKGKPRQGQQSTTTAVSKQYKHFEKAMQKAAQKNEQEELHELEQE